MISAPLSLHSVLTMSRTSALYGLQMISLLYFGQNTICYLHTRLACARGSGWFAIPLASPLPSAGTAFLQQIGEFFIAHPHGGRLSVSLRSTANGKNATGRLSAALICVSLSAP